LPPLLESDDKQISATRGALVTGQTSLPIALGLSAPVSHIDRGQRDCLAQALPTIATLVGAAARVIDGGYFASSTLNSVLDALERPKAGIILSETPDLRGIEKVMQSASTAQISVHHHNACAGPWPLEAMATGRTLLVLSGGGFALLPPQSAFNVLENASAALNAGDFVLITLEQPRDVALLEAAYLDFGSQIITTALSKIGRAEGFSPRVFSEPHAKSIRLAAIAEGSAKISWNGTSCEFPSGTWLDFGAIHITDASTAAQLHPDFEVERHWTSGDQIVSLLLLRRI
jgi:hypothetical protein